VQPVVAITESQSGRSWKGLGEVTSSNLPAQAGLPTASCPGLCPEGFGMSPRMETSQPPWATCAGAWSL